MSKVAFILVCWNNKNLLEGCIKSIEEQTYANRSVYLIDNNSSDGSADFVAKNYPSINLVRSKTNNGFAKGNNILIKMALSDPEVSHIALLNTDARLDKDWTKKLMGVAMSVPKVACLQGLTLDYFDHAMLDSHHIYITESLQSTQYGYQMLSARSNFTTCQVLGVNMAAAIVSRKFIEMQKHHKLFDESFYMYLEDVDVSLRSLNMGWKNYFVAGAIAYHMGSASSKTRSSSFALFYTARNQPAVLVKNFPLKILLKSTPAFLSNEYHMIRHLHNSYPKGTLSTYLRGRLIGILRVCMYLPKRRYISRRRVLRADFLWALMKNEGWIQ